MKRALVVLGVVGMLAGVMAIFAGSVFGSTTSHHRSIVYSDLQSVEAQAGNFDWSGACTGKGCAANIQPGDLQPGTQVPEVPAAALLLGALGTVGTGFVILTGRRNGSGPGL